jgi:hypothetical protein
MAVKTIKVDLPAEIFDVEVNIPNIAIKNYFANQII